MNKITNNNINNFLKTYNNFHDGNITNITYNTFESQVELTIKAYNWDIISNENNQPKKETLKLIFTDIKEIKIQEIFSWDFIYEATLKVIITNNEELFLFLDNINSSKVLVACKEINWGIIA